MPTQLMFERCRQQALPHVYTGWQHGSAEMHHEAGAEQAVAGAPQMDSRTAAQYCAYQSAGLRPLLLPPAQTCQRCLHHMDTFQGGTKHLTT